MKNFWQKVNKKHLVVGIALVVLISSMFFSYAEKINNDIANSLIRLHVVANSDSVFDQALKLRVRDRLVEYIRQNYGNVKNAQEAKALIEQQQGELQQLALSELLKSGVNYGARMDMGVFPFPTKNYGEVSLPAGNYQAVKVVLGDGEGLNWWCVLFPPLCFVDATHGMVPDSVKEEMKETFTSEEYDIITSASSQDDIPIKIKFKIVEVLQGTKIKITQKATEFFNRLFM